MAEYTTPVVDTSGEAVERLAARLHEACPVTQDMEHTLWGDLLDETAAMLRTLAAERAAAIVRAEAAEAERDALRVVAEAARVRW
jgi:hypothetical protein